MLNSAWNVGLGKDLIVRCQDTEWHVHSAILHRESGFFREILPSVSGGGVPQVILLDSHQEVTLGNALKFMYDLSYEGGGRDQWEAWEGDYIRLHVFKYVAGASVDVPAMMDFASERILEAAEFISDFAASNAGRDPGLLRFLWPLRLGLQMMFDQGATPAMVQLREALGELMRAARPVLWVSGAFQHLVVTKETGWGALWTRVESEVMTLPRPQRSHDRGSVGWVPGPDGSVLPDISRSGGAAGNSTPETTG